MSQVKPIKSLLVANRSEIAIRVMRAASELGIRTVAIYSAEDRFALHRTKADEAYLVGAGKRPLAAYLDIQDILRVAREANVDAIHPGYGFLSENPDFALACEQAGIRFVGPDATIMSRLGNKVAARELAQSVGVSVMPATGALPKDIEQAARLATEIGYPLMLKASWGGGGRGMRVVESASQLADMIDVCRSEAGAAFGNDEVYLEKLVRRARHVEVQILGDLHGNLVHLFERDCSVQRRNQKVVERAPAPYLDEGTRGKLCAAALDIARGAGYTHAGTVEFLMDADTGSFYFIEVNPRIQVEHTVTEQVTGIDIVKAQIRVTEGARIGDAGSYIPSQENIRLHGHALQCRITTEDPDKDFSPDYGTLTAYRSAAGFGIRLDAGTAYAGAVITPYYDSLLVKVTAWGHTPDEAAARMDRALREFRVRGISTNLQFLERVIAHPLFRSGSCTTRFIDQTPDLFKSRPRRDRATKLLQFIGEIVVNGNPEMKGRVAPDLSKIAPARPACDLASVPPSGTRDKLKSLGAAGFSKWMREHQGVLLTDTTLRDAHQSLFATRMRTADMLAIAPHYARMMPELFSLECWGGATFDVALRFLKEDPWDRLAALRERIPNILFQMLLRASNAVGYTNYPDNVVRHFVNQASRGGVDVFRVFDSLNWIENMRVAIDAVRDTGSLCEAAICYTGDIYDASRPKYNLGYYVTLAKDMERAGAQIIGIKDMAGVCRPRAARALIAALREEVGLPIHFHTHDTSGASVASVLAAVEAGVDAVDGALDSMSGLTSQPSLGAIVAALEGSERDTGVDLSALQSLSSYWEGVRRVYAPFEADIRSGTSTVYLHEMPGGQYTNLREQARSMGLESRWPLVEQTYAEVNQMFGDIIKVTPTSKVVGDMALFMVSHGLSRAEVEDPGKEVSFPESVISLFKGEIGFPAGGFPAVLSQKVLKGGAPLNGRAGALLNDVDFDAQRRAVRSITGGAHSEEDLASYLMYPKVFRDYAEHRNAFGDVSVLPTRVFLYGMRDGDETEIEIDRGKTLLVRLLGRSGPDDDGLCKLFFELNGQPRLIKVAKSGVTPTVSARIRIDDKNPLHIGAPMPGTIATVAVSEGQKVSRGERLLSLEAMKMETVVLADRDGTVKGVHVKPGDSVQTKDLLIELA